MLITTEVVAVAVPGGTFPSVADQLTVVVPVCAVDGVPVNVMLGFNAGPAEARPVKKAAVWVWLNVTFCASGSDAEAVTVTTAPAKPLTVAGFEITGVWFTSAIVIAVDAVEVPAVGVFVSVAVQLTV